MAEEVDLLFHETLVLFWTKKFRFSDVLALFVKLIYHDTEPTWWWWWWWWRWWCCCCCCWWWWWWWWWWWRRRRRWWWGGSTFEVTDIGIEKRGIWNSISKIKATQEKVITDFTSGIQRSDINSGIMSWYTLSRANWYQRNLFLWYQNVLPQLLLSTSEQRAEKLIYMIIRY